MDKSSKGSAFLRGVARVIDIGGGIGRPPKQPGVHPDRAAMRGDWYIIGRDFDVALKRVRKQYAGCFDAKR